MGWRPIPAITALVRDLDEQFPNRTRPDWVIGDADHSSRVSDHNPEDPDPGEGDWREVHAIDVRLGGGLDVRRLLEAVIGDQRVWYVIHDRRIYSRTHGWEARVYTGANPHETHVHVSFRYGEEWERDTSAFFAPEKPRTRPLPIDLSEVREQMLIALDLADGRVRESVHVRRLQRALRSHGIDPGPVDGLAGRRTANAWGRWERQRGVPGAGRPRVPDQRSLAALVAPRYRLVD